jgi:hypothetical protein
MYGNPPSLNEAIKSWYSPFIFATYKPVNWVPVLLSPIKILWALPLAMLVEFGSK